MLLIGQSCCEAAAQYADALDKAIVLRGQISSQFDSAELSITKACLSNLPLENDLTFNNCKIFHTT